MSDPKQEIRSYIVAIALVGIATMLMIGLDPYIKISNTSFLLFFGAVTLSAWYGGRWTGLVVTVVSAILAKYFFIDPKFSLSLTFASGSRLVIFIFQGWLISVLVGSLRRTQQRMQRSQRQREQAEADLRDSENRFQQLAAASPSVIYTVIEDSNGPTQFEYLSPAFETIHEISIGVALQNAQVVIEQMHPDDREGYRQAVERSIATLQPFQHEWRILTPSGRVKWLQANSQPQRRGNQVVWHGIVQDVTDAKQREAERQQVEDKLREREAALTEAQRLGNIGSWEWDAKTDVTTGSDQLLRIYGFDPETDTMPNFADQDGWLYPHESWQRINAGVQQALTTGQGYELDVQAFRNGTPIWITTRSEGVYDLNGEMIGLRGTVQDITERKQAEASLRNSEARYRLLAEAIPQLVWITNAEGQNEYVNQQFCDYAGLTHEEMCGLGWLSILHPDDQERTRNCWLAAVRSGEFYEIEYRFRRADGVYRWFLGKGIPVKDEQGRIKQWFGTCTDIEPQKQIEQTRLQLLEQEQAAREAAEQANRIKDEFLAVLSHELRTPMNPILGWSKLLKGGKLDATKAAQALETIDRNAQLQVQLIDDLLDISRILRGKLSLNRAPVNLNPVIAAAIDTVQLAAEAKAIAVQFISSPSDLIIQGDAGRLQQVIWNLLSNAVKFTSTGGQVGIKLSQAGTNAQIEVKDNGKGINPDFLPYVFEHFRQEDGATTRKFGGLGLGLSIARQIVELHGGYMSVESEGEGQGATFTVHLPLTLTSVGLPTSESASGIAFRDLTNLRILVVDDEPDSLEMAAFVLEQAGAIVTTATSGFEALEQIQQSVPDAIVSDIGMPEMDGYALLQQIRQIEQVQKIPAIALTAYAGEYDQRQAISAGFNQHIPKPVDPDLLVSAICSLCSKPLP
ncbi:two-component hybrid sensor and regulator [Leptolyngbya sp. NIES-3755]|nr:two-component hybrid sensor and regulator [Leptolyngbya sp. NIES-3755]